MSTANKTDTVEEHHHDLPLKESFIALLVITLVELGISELSEGGFATTLLLALTFAKAAIVGAVFMEIAYDKDLKSIITYVFIIPMIAVLFLIFTILADWR